MLTLMGTGLGIALTFLTQAILKQDESRIDDSDLPGLDFFSATAPRIRGSRNGSGLPPRSAPPATTRSLLSHTNRPRPFQAAAGLIFFGCFP